MASEPQRPGASSMSTLVLTLLLGIAVAAFGFWQLREADAEIEQLESLSAFYHAIESREFEEVEPLENAVPEVGLIENFSIIDLRARLSRRAGMHGRLFSPVTWTRQLVVDARPESSYQRAGELPFDFSLGDHSRRQIELRSLSHDYSVKRHTKSLNSGSSQAFRLSVDTSGESREIYPVSIAATYWNAFPDQEEEWVNLTVNYASKRLGFAVLFPRNMRFEGASGIEIDPAREVVETTDITPQDKRWDDKALTLRWVVDNPRIGHKYELRWKWAEIELSEFN